MAGNKYLEGRTDGRRGEKVSTQVSSGVPNAGEIPALDANGKLDQSLMPAGVAPDTTVLDASEALAAGDYLNMWDDTGTMKLRLADNSNDRRAHGFTKEAVALGNPVIMFRETTNSFRTGQTVGTRQYLGTLGQSTESTPTGSVILQYLGTAHSATEINIELSDEIVRVT